MGAVIQKMYSYHDFDKEIKFKEQPQQVFKLAQSVIDEFLEENPDIKLSHLLVATTCPDSVSPSLGQMIQNQYNSRLGVIPCIDMVQGCAGGVSSMVLGSQLAVLHRSSVLVVNADAAQKATSTQSGIHKNFGNGAFACLISYQESPKGMLYSASRQYQGLSEVVTVKLGHDADKIIQQNWEDLQKDPRKYLGLDMDNALALKLLKNAEQFYLDFVANSSHPDILILHQVNPMIISHLKGVFEKYNLMFVDVSTQTGNCGAATVGVALNLFKNNLDGNKVMLCSYGTGGVISAGMWQN